MTESPFTGLPDAARLWINAANRRLSTQEVDRLMEALADFTATWSSHGRRVEARTAAFENRFILIAAHIPGGDISGCGIDASVHALQNLAKSLGFEWSSALHVFYLGDDDIVAVDRATFAALAKKGHVTPETLVYDTSLTTVGEWRNGRFELPARRSWHGRVFTFATEVV